MRHLLLFPLLFCVLSASSLQDHQTKRKCSPNQAKVSIRREWRTLTAKEKGDYIKAVKKIREYPHGKDCTVDRIIAAHVKYSKVLHMVPCFLPWHRILVLKYEDLLQEVDPEIAQPFWQATLDSQKPHLSPIFDKDAFGGDGDEEDFCVKTGPFADYKVLEGGVRRCLKRRFICEDGTMDPFIGPEVVNSGLNKAKTFDQAATFIEISAHGPCHNNVGADLRSMASPSDPIFWLLHCWIDYLWSRWQHISPHHHDAYGPFPRAGPRTASPNDKLIYFTEFTVKDTFNIKNLGYEYEEFGSRKPALPPVKIQIPPNFADRAKMQHLQRNSAVKHFAKLVKRALEEKKNGAKGTTPIVTPEVKAKAANVVAVTLEGAAIQSTLAGRFVAAAVVIPVTPLITVSAAPMDRSHLERKGTSRLLKLVNAKAPLPEWNLLNGIPQDISDQQFAECRNITTKVNNIPGYVSPAAPWNNEKMLIRIVSDPRESKNIVAVVNGTMIKIRAPKDQDPAARAAFIKESIKASVASDVVQKSPVQLYKELAPIIGPPTTDKPSVGNPYSARHANEMNLLKKDAPKNPSDIGKVIEKKKAEGLVVLAIKPGGAAADLAAKHILPGLKERREEMKKVEKIIVSETKQKGLDVLKKEIKEVALDKKTAAGAKTEEKPKEKPKEEASKKHAKGGEGYQTETKY